MGFTRLGLFPLFLVCINAIILMEQTEALKKRMEIHNWQPERAVAPKE